MTLDIRNAAAGEGMGMPIAAVPYLPSLDCYRRWLSLRLDGMSDVDAWRSLLSAMPHDRRRHLGRTIVAGAGTNPPLTLSVPIEGGASTIKRSSPTEWKLSTHGRWSAVHLGALSAAYGVTPYYAHLESSLTDLIGNVRQGDSFPLLTLALHRMVADMLDVEVLLQPLKEALQRNPTRIHAIAAEKCAGAHAETAFIDVLFKRGPEALFTLLT